MEVRDGKVSSSSLDWLPAGTPVPWASTPKSPKLFLAADRPWLAAGEVKDGNGRILLLPLRDPEVLQEIADRTGYVVQAGSGTAGTDRSKKGVVIDIEKATKAEKAKDPDPDH